MYESQTSSSEIPPLAITLLQPHQAGGAYIGVTDVGFASCLPEFRFGWHSVTRPISCIFLPHTPSPWTAARQFSVGRCVYGFAGFESFAVYPSLMPHVHSSKSEWFD